MRWTTDPIDRVPWYLWALVPIWGPGILALMGLLALHDMKRRVLGPGPDWQPWFAWHPVKIDYRRLAWLEIVERSARSTAADIEYRYPEKKSDV